MLRHLCSCFLIASVLLRQTYGESESSQGGRPFVVVDALSAASIDDSDAVSFGLRGRQLAVAISRPESLSPSRTYPSLREAGRSDVYVQLSANESLIRITDGNSDGSGWSHPLWSPDGRFLAMLSTRGDTTSLWVWVRDTKELRRLSARSLSPYLAFEWVTSGQLVFRSASDWNENTANAIRGWGNAKQGTVASVSAIRAGADELDAELDSKIILASLEGPERVLVDQGGRSWAISPDRARIALISRVGNWTNVEISDFQGRRLAMHGDPLARVEASIIGGDDHSLSWSLDGTQLALLGHASAEGPKQLYVISVAESTVRTLGFTEYQPRAIYWTSANEILLLANGKAGAENTTGGCWLVDPYGRLLAPTPIIPGRIYRLYPERSGESYLVQGYGGQLMRWNVWTRRLAPASATPIMKLVWPHSRSPFNDSTPRSGREYDQVIVSNGDDEVALFRLDSADNAMRPLALPSPGARLLGYAPETDTTVFVRNDDSGLKLWRQDNNNRSQMIYSSNDYLVDIPQVKWQSLKYINEGGKGLRAWVALPFERRPDRRYPAVVAVYPGHESDRSRKTQLEGINLDLQDARLLSGRGFAVIYPTVPMDGARESGRPAETATNSILPAVDAAIDAGIADGERLFIVGHSFGGFATANMLRRTNRFKAAVAESPSHLNYSSMFGTFAGNVRYTNEAAKFSRPTSEVTSQGGMKGPPWQLPEQYIENSIIFHADKIHTPLMLIHGDLDAVVPIEQSEELFRALAQQNKRVEFVRYWGEDHQISSPANKRDRAYRMFAWFDEFGDIARDEKGNLLWDGDHVRSRHGAPALKPEDFALFERRELEDYAKAHPESETAKMLAREK